MSKEILYIWYDQGVKAKILPTGSELTTDQLKYLLGKIESMEIKGFAHPAAQNGSAELKITYDDVMVVLGNIEELRNTGILQGTMRKRVDELQKRRIEMLKNSSKKCVKKVEKDYYQDNRNILNSRNISIEEQTPKKAQIEVNYTVEKIKEESNKSLKVERKKKWNKITKVVVPTGIAAILLIGGIVTTKFISDKKEEIPTDDETITAPLIEEEKDVVFAPDLDITREFPEAFKDTPEEECTYLSYEDQSQSPKAVETKNRYSSLIEKYSKKCGLDSRVILAIATQESGNHEYGLRHGSTGGLMQIEISYWDGKEIEYYDFDDEKSYIIKIDKEAIKDVENNILVGCAIYQNELQNFNYNPFLATLSYNQGCTNTNKILKYASKQEGKSKLEFINNYNNLNWMEYTSITGTGDPNYVNKVFSYTGFGYNFFELEFTKETGEKVIATTGPIISEETKQFSF